VAACRVATVAAKPLITFVMLLVGWEVGSQSLVVRFACHDCPWIGRYRPAVLAERFGDTGRKRFQLCAHR
jgi:hypothetical protein